MHFFLPPQSERLVFTPVGGKGVHLFRLHHGRLPDQLYGEFSASLFIFPLVFSQPRFMSAAFPNVSPGGHWLHRVQRRSQIASVSALHQPSGGQWVPVCYLVGRQCHPGLWQVRMRNQATIEPEKASLFTYECRPSDVVTRCFLRLDLELRSLLRGRSDLIQASLNAAFWRLILGWNLNPSTNFPLRFPTSFLLILSPPIPFVQVRVHFSALLATRHGLLKVCLCVCVCRHWRCRGGIPSVSAPD